MELRDPMESFLRAQKKRMRAYEEGAYELDEEEGFRCESCGWRGLSAPMADENKRDIENNVFLQCPECEDPALMGGDVKVEYYQRFGYEYDAMPKEIPNGEAESHKIEL